MRVFPRITLPWATASGIALITLIPLAVIAASVLHPDPVIWRHLRDFVLSELLVNTLWLVFGVGLGVLLVGVSSAWLTAAYEFPGRRLFEWALLLPLALPAYISAFVWLGLFDVTGSVSLWLREIGVVLPMIRSRGGIILLLSLSLYPYVFLTARAAFLGQGARLLEAAQSLGLSRRQAFWRVALPMAYPGIVAGLILALMETLAEFGAVSIFNYNTFTAAIYKAWFGLFSLTMASQLASMLVFFVLLALLIEGQMRARRHYAAAARAGEKPLRWHLRGGMAFAASSWCAALLFISFLLPVAQIGWWAWDMGSTDLDSRYWGFALHSLWLGGLGAVCVVSLAMALGYAQRLQPGGGMRLMTRLATLGYAMPGAVLAVGLFIPQAWLDNQMIAAGIVQAPVLQGTLIVMLLAYAARFTAVAFNPIEAGLVRISPRIDEAAQLFGVTGLARLRRVHLPMLSVSVLTAAALVFVDILKELPITLMTRPFGWDTLAVRVFEMTSEGEWERAALPALAIIVVGLLPVWLLTKGQDHALAC